MEEIPIKDGTIEYSEVIESSNLKDELYANAKTWAANFFKSSKDAISLEDKETGRLIAKYNTYPSFSYIGQRRTAEVRMSVQIDCKDGRYRYIVKVLDYYHDKTPQNIGDLIDLANGKKKSLTNNKGYAKKQLAGIVGSVDTLISSIKMGMKSINNDF
jgi:hypothetical protein